MSGHYSRRKGLRNEYLVRDALRAEGFEADRVPSSGAAEGFKGDIKFGREGKSWLAEVKVRGAYTFKNVYELWLEHNKGGRVSVAVPMAKLWCIDIADTMAKVMDTDSAYLPIEHKGAVQAVKIHKLLGPSDFLVIRNDHKPFLYLRYR